MTNFLTASLEIDDADPPGFRARYTKLGPAAGCERLGISVYEMDPGEAVCPYHLHLGEEELLLVVSGRPALRTPEGWRDLEEGDVVAFPVGERGAHQVANRSDAPARVVFVSESIPFEVAVYPDSEKVGVSGRDVMKLRELFRLGTGLDYWDGEAPPEPPAG